MLNTFDLEIPSVLPQSYDTSLRFDDLLMNVVNYLNAAISALNTNTNNVDNVNTQYNALVNSVNEFKDEIEKSIITKENTIDLINKIIEGGEANVGVKSIQDVTIILAAGETENIAEITPVALNKAVIIPRGFNTNSTSANPSNVPYIQLLNASEVQARRTGNEDKYTITASVVEFF